MGIRPLPFGRDRPGDLRQRSSLRSRWAKLFANHSWPRGRKARRWARRRPERPRLSKARSNLETGDCAALQYWRARSAAVVLLMAMEALKAVVKNGRLVLDAPTDL